MNNDHMQQAEKELSEEREMKLDFICKKCGSIEYEIKDKSNGTGIAHGLYCAKCGFWHKWIGKEELKRFSETKQKEKVYSVDEVNHLISEMDKVIAKLKTENAALRERLEKYKISFKKVYMDFFSKLNLDKDFRKCEKKDAEDATRDILDMVVKNRISIAEEIEEEENND